MYFVPEGQHDSSQVRSAWVAIQKDPSPGGTAEVIVTMNIERAKGVGQGGLYSGISNNKTYCYYVFLARS